MTPAEAFALRPEEQERLNALAFSGDEDVWRFFAGFVHTAVIQARRDDDITLERALEVMRACSLGCRLNDRIALVALTAWRALDNPPVSRNGRENQRPPNPPWVKHSAVELVRMLRKSRPDEPITPNEHNGWTTPILKEAIRQLVLLNLCRSLKPRTLYKWWNEATNHASSS